ncbi:MAG: DUF4115 domain-containing protein [Zoogloeaceae bacterium]|jgi:cytoskeleton protein RodZ|nr:DUF4115 domain-containing protein [Zoogloeaceae bacterium]
MTEVAQPDVSPNPVHTAATAGILVGEKLRAGREAQGLSVLEAASRLRLGARQIEALEAGEFSRLPGKTFVRSIVRSYANALELDAAQLLGLLDQVEGLATPTLALPESTHVIMPEAYAHVPPRGWNTRLLLAVIALIVSAVLLYVFVPSLELERLFAAAPVEPDSPVEISAQEATRLPLEIPSAPVSETLALAPLAVDEGTATRTLQFHFSGESWIEVQDGNDRILVSRRFAAGQSQSLSGTPPLLVTIGDAAQVQLFDNGTRVPLSPQSNTRVAKVRLPLPPAGAQTAPKNKPLKNPSQAASVAAESPARKTGVEP